MSGRSPEVGRVIMDDGRVQKYTVRDMDTLRKFDTILRTKRDIASALADDQSPALVQREELEDGTTAEEVIMPLDDAVVRNMAQMAFNMYRFYGREPQLRVAMDKMLQNAKGEDAVQREEEIGKLEAMWDQP
jgi:hypothetical protein